MNNEKKRRGWSRRDMVTAASIATVAGVIGRSTTDAATVDSSFELFGLKGSAAAIGIAFISSVANLAGFFTPWLTGLVRTLTGHYTSSFLTVACIQAVAAIALLAWTPVARRER